MIRLIALCLLPLLLALPAAADCLDDLKAQLARIELKLANGTMPPETAPTVPATGGNDCSPPYILNGSGEARPVCLPAVVTVRNATPGASITYVKVPLIVAGLVKVYENGVLVSEAGQGGKFSVGLGDRQYRFEGPPGARLSVLLRP